MVARPSHPKRPGGMMARALIAMLAVAAPAVTFAQTAAPQPGGLKNAPPVWLGYLVIFLLLLMVMFISLMPSKRSHQD